MALQDQLNPAQQKAQIQTFPPPVGGWNARDSLPNMAPTDAVLLVNMLPQPAQVVTRGGNAVWSASFASPVQTIIPYNAATVGSKKLFAASGTAIWDITTAGTNTSVVSGMTNAWWQWVNFATSAGQFLQLVNGVDTMQTWNGTAWTATPSFNAGALLSNTLINLCVYNSTMYYVQENTLGFWYAPAQTIFSTTLTYQNMAAWCPRGGYCMAMASWTVDGGQGPQDYLVAITSEGEVVVWQGLAFSIAIGTAGYMAFVGSYYIGRPLGRRCFLKYGGDLLVLTERGLFPMSTGLQSATIDKRVGLTDKIEPAYVALAQTTFGTNGWQIESNFGDQFLIVNVPTTPPQQLVMQYQTKGWANWTGWKANCFLYYNGLLYYGDADHVYECYVGSTDTVAGVAGTIYATVLPAFTQLKILGQQKHVKMVRPYLEANGSSVGFNIAAAVDYNIPTVAITISVGSGSTAALWDSGVWDTAIWGGGAFTQFKPWTTVAAWPCVAFSPFIQFATNTQTIGLQAYDVVFTVGGVL